jgi:hypothetical protein
MKTLLKIQNELKVPKGNFNSFGKYKYRSAEDILEAVKPILLSNDATVILSDEVVEVGGKVFVKATAYFQADEQQFTVCGYAETSEHKGMSSEQTTGTASSYARKYALNGLFLIDETQADPDNETVKPKEVAPTIDVPRLETRLNACKTPEAINALFKTFTPAEQTAVKEFAIKLGKELMQKITVAG